MVKKLKLRFSLGELQRIKDHQRRVREERAEIAAELAALPKRDVFGRPIKPKPAPPKPLPSNARPGAKFRAKRIALGLSVNVVAHYKWSPGVYGTGATLDRWERGTNYPDDKTIARWREALRVLPKLLELKKRKARFYRTAARRHGIKSGEVRAAKKPRVKSTPKPKAPKPKVPETLEQRKARFYPTDARRQGISAIDRKSRFYPSAARRASLTATPRLR